MRRSSADTSSASGLRTTAASKGMRKLAADCRRDLCHLLGRAAEPIEPRHERGMQARGDPSAGDGTAATARTAAVSLPASNTALVISSTNKGIPSVRSMMSCRMLADSSLLPTMRSIMAPTSCSASRLMMRAVT